MTKQASRFFIQKISMISNDKPHTNIPYPKATLLTLEHGVVHVNSGESHHFI
ncbi:hypothetical protein I4Q36_06550 [Tuanshanicoccus lijuaniae]|uniref:hypothetical protein n=1 Tax=Aerococcaceae bacterium zg-1292 TaxID=2774330 RepID=UPI00193754D2|nr:hypothetical protein [Aerococcaceae bacterium zg-1292]QQA36474.1 hypothetical protein I4Q36_06550 [Aerococcaceae bacterium zg-1292]